MKYSPNLGSHSVCQSLSESLVCGKQDLRKFIRGKHKMRQDKTLHYPLYTSFLLIHIPS